MSFQQFPISFLLQVQNNMSAGIASAKTELTGLGTAGSTAGTGLNETGEAVGKIANNTQLTGFQTFMKIGPSIAALAGSAVFLAFSFQSVATAQLKVDKATQSLKDKNDAVTKAQMAYNDAVAQFGPNSDEAKTALDNLKDAQNKAQIATDQLALRQDQLTESYLTFGLSLGTTVLSGLASVSSIAGVLGAEGGPLAKLTSKLSAIGSMSFSGLGSLTGILGPLAIAAVFVAAIVDKAAGAFEHLNTALGATDQATKLNELSAAMRSLKTSDFNVWSDFITMFTTSSGPIDMWTTAIDNAMQAAKNGTQATDPLIQFSNAVQEVINAMATFSGTTLPAWWNTFATGLTDAIVSTWKAFASAVDFVGTNIGSLLDLDPTGWPEFVETVSNIVTSTWEAFSDAVQSTADALTTLFNLAKPEWWDDFIGSGLGWKGLDPFAPRTTPQSGADGQGGFQNVAMNGGRGGGGPDMSWVQTYAAGLVVAAQATAIFNQKVQTEFSAMYTAVTGIMNGLTTVLAGMTTGVTTLFGTMTTAGTTLIGSLAQTSVQLVSAMVQGINILVGSMTVQVVSDIGIMVQSVTTLIGAMAQTSVQLISAMVQGAKALIVDMNQSIQSEISALWEASTQIFSSFASAWSSTMNFVKNNANTGISGINSLQSAINKLQSKTITITTIHRTVYQTVGRLTSRFASGGDFITAGPQLILVGDNPSGKERVQVTPLAGGTGGGSRSGSPSIGAGGSQVIQIVVDGRVLAEVVANRMNQNQAVYK